MMPSFPSSSTSSSTSSSLFTSPPPQSSASPLFDDDHSPQHSQTSLPSTTSFHQGHTYTTTSSSQCSARPLSSFPFSSASSAGSSRTTSLFDEENETLPHSHSHHEQYTHTAAPSSQYSALPSSSLPFSSASSASGRRTTPLFDEDDQTSPDSHSHHEQYTHTAVPLPQSHYAMPSHTTAYPYPSPSSMYPMSSHLQAMSQFENATPTVMDRDTEIRIARPLKELLSHVTHFTLPRLELIGRVIKTLVLAIFRWHLCDRIVLKDRDDDNVCYNLSGRRIVENTETFDEKYPFLLQNAYQLKLEDHEPITPDMICADIKKMRAVDLTHKKTGNTIADLLASKQLRIVVS